jgi:hypothetical protein
MQREETGGGLQIRRQRAARNNSTQGNVTMFERTGSVFFDFTPHDGWHENIRKMRQQIDGSQLI